MLPLLPQEQKVLECIWEKDMPCVISDILKSDEAFNRNTVSKALVSLERKGYIAVDSIRKTITRTAKAYKAIISRKEYEQQLELVEAAQSGVSMSETALSFMSALLGSDSKEVSDGFIEKMEQMIQEYKDKEN